MGVARADLTRRLTYLMLFRVVVTTLLFGAAVTAELAASGSTERPTATALFALVGSSYALTLVWALVLRYRPTSRGGRLALTQVGYDLASVAFLVHLTGGAESGFVFLFLLVVISASTVLSGRGTLAATATATLLYCGVSLGGRWGWIPAWAGSEPPELPVGLFARIVATNLVALGAVAALSSRLAVELERAGERIVAQGARLENLATLHADVVRSITSGLILLTDAGGVLSVNEAGAEILGVDAPSTAGRPIDALWPELAALVAGGAERVRRAEVMVRRSDGTTRTVGLSASPLFTADGKATGRVVSFHDLSELKEMREQIERTTRLAGIGRLAAAVAHEVRNPLAAISGSIELLRTTPPGDREGAELWDIVEREIQRVNLLITDLLDFARPRPPQRAPLEVGAAITEMLRVFENDKRLAGGRVELRAGPSLWVEADPGQLRQVVWNLLRNAAEATQNDTPIVVSTRAEGTEEDPWVRIVVRDRGSGIAETARARLFEPFFSTKRGGTGLGLATVHRIIDEHHGRIELSNAEGGGVEARVWLRRCSPPA